MRDERGLNFAIQWLTIPPVRGFQTKMRGQWIINVINRMLDRSFSMMDGLRFIYARFGPVPLSFSLGPVSFSKVDRTIWSVCSEVFMGRCYTPAGFEIGRSDIVVDIGAHRGVFVAFAALATQNAIHAYEPSLENFRQLTRLIQENGWENIQVFNRAVASTSGNVTLFQSDSHTRHSIIDKDILSGEQLVATEEVACVTLEEVVLPFETVDFLKMDCEGSEFPIILNAKPETIEKIARIAMEYHGDLNSMNMQSLINRLKEFYNCVIIQPGSHPGLGYIFARN